MQEVPQQGIEPVPSTLGGQSLNHWMGREVQEKQYHPRIQPSQLTFVLSFAACKALYRWELIYSREKAGKSFLVSIFISAEVPKGLVIYPGLSRTKEKTKQNMRKENPRKREWTAFKELLASQPLCHRGPSASLRAVQQSHSALLVSPPMTSQTRLQGKPGKSPHSSSQGWGLLETLGFILN